MSYEADLKSHYSDVSRRLGKVPPPTTVIIREEPKVGELEKQIAAMTRRLDSLENMNDALAGRVKFLDGVINPRIEAEVPTSKIAGPTIEHIINRTAFYFGVTVEDIKGQRRDTKIITPRQVAMYLSRHLTMKSLPNIGFHFEGRDHSTVLHAIRKITARRPVDGILNESITAIERAIKNTVIPILVAAE